MATTSTRFVNVDNLDVYAGPSENEKITGVLSLNDAVTVEDAGFEWVRVTTDEVSGFVMTDFLSEEKQ